MEEMLTHALPPLVEAGNKAALEVLAQKAGVDPATLVHSHCHTIIAKCLYEGMPQMMTSTPQDNMASATIIRVQLQSQLEPSSVVLHCADLQQWYTCKHQALDGLVRGPKDDL